MRGLPLLLVLAVAGCAAPSPFTRVKTASSIDDARAKLDGYEPKVKHYGPNAEAWYFVNDDCVLFVDGQVRMTRAAAEKITYVGTEKDPAQPQEDACAPKETRLVK